MHLEPLLLHKHGHNQRLLQNLRFERPNISVTWKVQLSLQLQFCFCSLAPAPLSPPSLYSHHFFPCPLPVTALELCRRLARKRREAELVAFSATKPDNSFESPADVQAIRQAQQNIGDFKLKSDPEYIPPEVFTHALSIASLVLETNTFLSSA